MSRRVAIKTQAEGTRSLLKFITFFNPIPTGLGHMTLIYGLILVGIGLKTLYIKSNGCIHGCIKG